MIIALSGISGVGKTTLAQKIAKQLDMKFVSGSAKELWDKYDIINHRHLIEKTIHDIKWGFDFQLELLDLRYQKIREHGSFVTDRGPIDNLVYFLAQLAPFLEEDEVAHYIGACGDLFQDIDHQIYISYERAIKLEDDNARITNRYYQNTMHALFEQVIYDKNYLNICRGCINKIPNSMAYNERLNYALHFINEKINSNISK